MLTSGCLFKFQASEPFKNILQSQRSNFPAVVYAWKAVTYVIGSATADLRPNARFIQHFVPGTISLSSKLVCWPFWRTALESLR